MSVVNPTIDDLLSVTDENRFLLCEIASRRARDINDMMRNQHNRAEQLADISAEDISQFMSDDEGRAPNPLSIAFDEIAPRHDDDGEVKPGILSFDARCLHADLGLEDVASDAQVAPAEERAGIAVCPQGADEGDEATDAPAVEPECKGHEGVGLEDLAEEAE